MNVGGTLIFRCLSTSFLRKFLEFLRRPAYIENSEKFFYQNYFVAPRIILVTEINLYMGRILWPSFIV